MNEEDQRRHAELAEEYKKLAHAMQSGVAAEMHFTKQTDPKHLRVGVNMAMVNTSALAGLLIRKGVITELEYAEALRDALKAEVDRYEQRLTEHFGKPVHLA